MESKLNVNKQWRIRIFFQQRIRNRIVHMGKTKTMNQARHRQIDNSRIQNYLALIAIVPALLSIPAVELLMFLMNSFYPGKFVYRPVTGLGILIPMALMTEAFTYLFSRRLLKRAMKITDAVEQVGSGDFHVSLSEKHMEPFTEVVKALNTMTKQLQNMETLSSDFINDFSHEFKTPITSINGFANLLLDSEVSPEEEKQYLQIIADESQHLASLSQQTILLSRLDHQTIVTDQKLYALDEQIRQDIILFSDQWSKKNIEMNVDLEETTYYGNPDLMSHIWINLLNNAIKFTPDHGTISVRCRNTDDKILCTFSDTGKGMGEEEQKQIFNRFYQADRSHASGGLGLGLSIAARAAVLCNGTIEVESTPDRGSTFTVTLPKQKEESYGSHSGR